MVVSLPLLFLLFLSILNGHIWDNVLLPDSMCEVHPFAHILDILDIVLAMELLLFPCSVNKRSSIPYCLLYNDAAKILVSCGFCKAFGFFAAFCLVFLRCFVWCFCGNSFGFFAQFAIPCEPLRQRKFKIKLSSQVQTHAFSKTSK